MSKALLFELFGYLGSVLVLVSMLMTSVVRLRVINLIGSAIFAAYAILIRSYPTAFLNACLVGVNVYQLLRLRRSGESSYETRAIGAGEGFVLWFLRRYWEDIRQFFPDVTEEAARDAAGFAVFYDDQAAGILLGRQTGGDFEILLDYSTPSFRDCSVGECLYASLPAVGVDRLICRAENAEHVRYMEKMGFVRREDQRFVKELPAAKGS